MRSFSYCIALLLISVQLSFGQTEKGRISLEVGGGIMIPVFSYASHDAEGSAIFLPGALNFKGFSKIRAGFAEPGVNMNIRLKYRLGDHWYALANAGGFQHAVNTRSMAQFISFLRYDAEVHMPEVTTKVFYLMPGVSYGIRARKSELNPFVSLGWSLTNYPIYYATIIQPGQIVYFNHLGETPNLHAVSFEAGFSWCYHLTDRLYLGADVSYYQSKFSYAIMNDFYEEGEDSYPFEFVDKLSVKALLSILKIGIRL